MTQLITEDVISISKWIPIIKSYKYEMKPSKNKEVEMNKTLGICRHLYNWSLGERKDAWEGGGWRVRYKDQQDYLKRLRNGLDNKIGKEFGKELQDVYEQIEQNVLKRVDFAYQRFFERVNNNKKDPYKKPGFPRFKGYGRYDSFTFPQYGNGCDVRGKNNDIIRLSKIGEIKFIKHRDIGENGIPYLIKTVTIKREIDKWFIIFTVDTFVEIEVPIIQKEIKSVEELDSKSVGIDMGLSNLATLSNGKKIEPPKYLIESEKILAKHQRRLSRKKREEKEIEIIDRKTKQKITKKIKVNSKNREKERIKVAKIHRKIANQRRNFNHDVSRTLLDNFDLIAFEELNIQNMIQNHRLAKIISDASWYQLQTMVSYKAEWAGKIVEFVDPKLTSQNCSDCGKLVGRIREGDIFQCPFCGLTINVHVNAGINIRNRSIEYQNRLKKLNIENTSATGGMACLSSPDRDTVIQEALPNMKDGNIENTSIQAPPFRAG